MLPSVGYFKSIVCPYFENDSCERPYCQFRHDVLNKGPKSSTAQRTMQLPLSAGPSQEAEDSKSLAIEQIVSEAVKRVLKENQDLLSNVDATKIMELVGQQKLVEKVVQNLPLATNSGKQPVSVPNNLKAKGHKLYTIPAGIPAYTPTPISVLKKTKPHGSKVESYVPARASSQANISYEPSKVSSRVEESYKLPNTLPDVNYTPSCRDSDNVIWGKSQEYTPSMSSGCVVDYQPTSKALSSGEPSYSPANCSGGSGVDYSPSSITTLMSEPTYSPVVSKKHLKVEYTPSSLLGKEQVYSPLSPERYLAMLENAEETTKSDSSSKDSKDNNSSKRSIGRKAEDVKHSREDDKSKERSRIREKQRDKDREKEREKERSREKERDRKRKDARKEDEKRERNKDRRKDSEGEDSSKTKSSSSKRSDSKSSVSKEKSHSSKKSAPCKASSEDFSDSMFSDSVAERDSDSDVDEECFRIFQEYQPKEMNGPNEIKRKSEEMAAPSSDVVIPVKKQRIAHVATTEGFPVPNASRCSVSSTPKPPPKLSPSMMMIDRFKKLQAAAAAAAASPRPKLTPASDKKRIAHVPNVLGLLTSRPRTAQTNSAGDKTSTAPVKVPQMAGKAAGSAPTAVPRQTSLPRPVIAVEYGCKVPANVRQRYLNIFVDEMLKIYDREQDAYDRAVAEEKQCYSRSNSKTVYLNVVVNNVNRLRKEAESGGVKPAAASSGSSAESNNSERKVMSHSAMLAGKGGATVSWSIEKPRTKLDSSLLTGTSLYKLLERYVLSMELQDLNGYPRPDLSEKGKAVINTVNKYRQKPNINLTHDQRLCDRCGTVYRVDRKGLAVKTDEMCTYHWGRPFQRRGEKRYSCCQGESTSEGCCVGKWHVSDTLNMDNMKGFVATLSKSPPSDGNYGVYALDCEMCYTTEGPELTRVTVVGVEGQTVYETLVKPDNPILDHNTRFSGISEEDLQNVRTTIRDVQAVLLSRFSDKTILIGHSFDSDLRALRMIHNTVIDTSVVFPHSKGPPFKRALRTLCAEILQKIIQNGVGGHDSAEDAVACMDLMIWKVKQDLKLLK